MSKIKDSIEDENIARENEMAEDFKMFKKEHEAGQHADGIVPFCELCEEKRSNVLPIKVHSYEDCAKLPNKNRCVFHTNYDMGGDNYPPGFDQNYLN